MATKLDKVIARKELDEKVRKEIRRRLNISKKTKGKKRTRKPKSKHKKRRKKKVTTTQVAQPPIRLDNKKGDKLEVNIVAKERRKKRKKPKTFAERRAEEIAGTGIADPSVFKQQQRITSEALGYQTQTKDPLTLRGKVGRYNVAGGVAGFHDVSARYDTREPQQGIRTPQNTIEQRLEQLEEKVSGPAFKRSSRRPNMKGGRRKPDDDDDDDDDFFSPRGKPPPAPSAARRTRYPPYDFSGFRPISELEPPEDVFFDPAGPQPPLPVRPLTAETRAKIKPITDPDEAPPAPASMGDIRPKSVRATKRTPSTDDDPPTQPQPIFIGGGPPKQKFKKASRISIPPPAANFGVDPEPDPTSFAGKKKPQPQPEPEPAPAPRPESPIEDFEFEDVQGEEPPQPVPVEQEEVQPERREEEDKPPIQSVRRGRPPGSKQKPQSEETKELKAEGKRLLAILKNVLGKGNFKAKDLDTIRSDAEFDAFDFEAVYGDIDPETASNLRLYWMVRQALGRT